MKRISILFAATAMLWGGVVQAQSTDGGLPWSIAEQRSVNDAKIPVIQIEAPNYEVLDKPSFGAYRAGLLVQTDVDLQNAGTFFYLPDGGKIWTVKIAVEGAKALNVYYDRFYLPKGVNLFLKNENEKQIVGAINYKYNPATETYATTAVQGNVVTIELDIDAGVSMDDIRFHINRLGAQVRGGEVTALDWAYGPDADISQDAKLKPTYANDTSDPCEVNAICDPEGSTFANLKQTVAHIVFPMGGNYVGFCSGNLMNNTNHDCKPLFLTASHCDGSNHTDNAYFSQALFYFNYEYPNCTGDPEGSAPMTDYLTGATFRARSHYEAGNPQIVGDFLLLELTDPLNKLGNSFNAYLAGWDINYITPQQTKYIDFHHPAGDPKKVSVFKNMTPDGNFNGGANGSHWKASPLEKGGIEGGSSGSGIFAESNGRLYGDLSGGPSNVGACDTSSQNWSVYSKLYLNWEYASGTDGTAATRLKDWLDPNGTGMTFTNTVPVAADGDTCQNQSGVNDLKAQLNGAIEVYPNPSSGLVKMRVHLPKATDIKVTVFNVLGVKVATFSANNILQGEIKMNMSDLTSGLYMLYVESNEAAITKKIVLSH